MGAADSHLTGPQVLSLVQVKCAFDIQNLSMVPARLYAVGNQMLQTSTTHHMHSALGLPQVQPILTPAISKSRNICVCFLKASKLLRENLPSDFSTYTDDKIIVPVPHHICKRYNFAAIEK